MALQKCNVNFQPEFWGDLFAMNFGREFLEGEFLRGVFSY